MRAFAALAPIAILLVAFAAYCAIDAARAPATRLLPKWAWVLISLASIPLGGLAYLIFGRERT